MARRGINYQLLTMLYNFHYVCHVLVRLNPQKTGLFWKLNRRGGGGGGGGGGCMMAMLVMVMDHGHKNSQGGHDGPQSF